MYLFFTLAYNLLNAIGDIGDWLLYSPFSETFGYDASIAELILGGGLTVLLAIKVTKFFVGIVTGS